MEIADQSGPGPARRRVLGDAGLLVLVALPGAVTAFLSFRSGGFFPGATALVAVQLALLLIWRIAVGRRPFEGVGPSVCVAAAALALLAGWTLWSSGWSGAQGRAVIEFDRVVLYLLALVLFATIARTVQRVRWMVYALAAAIVVVCVAALVARLFPQLGLADAPVHPERLGYPLTYWNALGLLMGIGTILCGHLASSEREPAVARVLGAAAVPLLAATLYYTFSRGATWAALVAVAIYLVVGRPRAVVGAGLAMVPAVLLALAAVNPASVLTGDPGSQAAIDAGRQIALTLAACAFGAGLLRALLLPLDRRLQRISLPSRSRRIVLGVAAAVAFGSAAVMAADTARFATDKIDEFKSETSVAGAGSARLLQFENNGRIGHWEVAVDSYRREPLTGSGAGTYALDWDRDRQGSLDVENAHSLYLEVLGELGIPGLLALGLCLLMILGAFAVRARGPDRALFAALLAAGTAWAVHAAVDWVWEMPALTVWLFALGGAALAREPHPPRRAHRLAPVLRAAGVGACVALAIVPARLAVSEARLDNALVALRDGDCAAASADAHASHDILGSRAEPFQVIAFCERGNGRVAAALAAMQEGLQRDPDNWEFQYGLAVTRAATGLDPREAARRAVRLNPLGVIAQNGLALFDTVDRRSWRQRGLDAPLTLPD